MLHLGIESILTELSMDMIKVCDEWLGEGGVSLDLYLDQVKIVGEDCDGLFIWAVSKWLEKRITVASMVGLWSSMTDNDLEEVFLVFTENGFHRLLPCCEQQESLPFPFQPLC